MVSVIVLTYNHEKYIKQALDSILEQKVDFKYEILIGDDASTDSTSDIVREYAANYPDVVCAYVREKNIGATNNLYDLLCRAQGNYIACCEGDDFWTDPSKLQVQIEWLEIYPEYIGCCHICSVVNEKGQEITKPKWICEKDVFRFEDFGAITLPGHPSTWIYRNIYLDPIHDYSIICRAHSTIADRTIAMILLAQGDFALIHQNMSCYRSIQKVDGTNATSQLFVNQDCSKFVEYQLTLTLEHYAREELKVKANFSAFRCTLFFKAFAKLIIKPCKSRWQCVKDIVHAAISK